MNQNKNKVSLEPKVNVRLDHLSINLVSIDKVKLYVQEIESLPWVNGFLFLFAGLLFDRIMLQGLSIAEPLTILLGLITLIFLGFTIKIYFAKKNAWRDIERSRIDLDKSQ